MSTNPVSKISVKPLDRNKPYHRGAMLLEGIPLTTKAAFKAACALRGKTMRDVFITFMRAYAKRHGNVDETGEIE